MELRVRADALGRVLHEDRLRVADLVRLQARQAVGDQLRQHRQHAVGQVDARAAVVGLAVQGRPRADEVRNVGDVYAQPPMAVVELLQGNGIVEIAGVDRIDGDDRLAGQIEPAFDRLVEAVRLLPGLFQSVCGEFLGQVELADDRERIDARRALRPQDLDDHPFAVVYGRGEADHFHDHFVVGPGVLGSRIADEDRLGEERAVDLHEGRALRLEIGADELPRLPLEDLDHAAPRPQPRTRLWVADVFDLDGHHVAAGRIERVFCRDEDVFYFTHFGGSFFPLAVFGRTCRRRPDEAESLLGPRKDAHHPWPGVLGTLALAWRKGLKRLFVPLALRERGRG